MIPWWAFLISTLTPVCALLASTWIGFWDVRVKAKAEAVEADVKLLGSFSALASIADAREGAFLSEVVAQKLVEGWSGPPAPLDLRPAVAQGSVAAARQAGVVTAIAELSQRHNLLEEPGRSMLRGLKHLAEHDHVRDAYFAACDRVGIVVESRSQGPPGSVSGSEGGDGHR